MVEKESSGFPLDDMLDGIEVPEPKDDWEIQEKAKKKAGAKLLAKAIFKGDCSSEDAIAKTIENFQNTVSVMRSMY